MTSLDRPRLADDIASWLLLAVIGLLFGALAGLLLVRAFEPVYQATATVEVIAGNSGGASASSADMQTAQQLARTYSESMRARPVVEESMVQSGAALPIRDLLERLKVTHVRDTQLLRVSVEDTDPARAAELANALVTVFNRRNQDVQAQRFEAQRDSLSKVADSLRAEIDSRTYQVAELRNQPPSPERDVELMGREAGLAQLQATYTTNLQGYHNLLLAQANSTGAINLVEPALAPERPIRPNRLLVTALAAMAGLALALAGGFLYRFLSDKLPDRRRVQAATGLAALGEIPRARSEAPSEQQLQSASYYMLASNLLAVTSGSPLRSLVVTSPERGEGKTTTAANLASVLARSGKRILLVDADIERPAIMDLFELSNARGLVDALTESAAPLTDFVHATSVPGLDVLVAGQRPADTPALFSSRRLRDRLAEMATAYDMVIVDSPPVLTGADTPLLAGQVDGVLLVCDAARTRGRAAARAADVLRESGALVAFAVLNGCAAPTKSRSDEGRTEAPVAAHPVPAAALMSTPASAASPASRFSVAGIQVSRTNYREATDSIIDAANQRTSFTVAATSVHGVAMGTLDPSFQRVLNGFDVVTPDGQPVRWALNLLHGTGLRQRVYGPNLMWLVCEEAARAGQSIYLYGSRQEVLDRLTTRLANDIPELRVAGSYSPPFRPTTPEEDEEEVRKIVDSGANILFVGLGCPRQEVWAAAHRDRLPMAIVCVGAAFDFHAGTLSQAPTWMQANGLEWLYRLSREPRRLWRRYAKHIPVFVAAVAKQYVSERVVRIPRGTAKPNFQTRTPILYTERKT